MTEEEKQLECEKYVERIASIGFLYMTTYGLSKRIVIDTIYESWGDMYKQLLIKERRNKCA